MAYRQYLPPTTRNAPRHPDKAPRPITDEQIVEALDRDLIQDLQQRRNRSIPMTPPTVMQLQRAVGNQAVMRLLDRGSPQPVIQRDAAPQEEEQPAEGEAELTLEGEQELLQRKPLAYTPPTIQRMDPDTISRATAIIQRAWTGRRQLGNLNALLGRPWVWRRRGNIFNWGGYHEHIFFEDGQQPPDIGHMGKQGLGQDTGREDEYSRVETDLDDATMRESVEENEDMAAPGTYGLLTNNCQMFVQAVLRTYRAKMRAR
jgi:hypothetical protein